MKNAQHVAPKRSEGGCSMTAPELHAPLGVHALLPATGIEHKSCSAGFQTCRVADF